MRMRRCAYSLLAAAVVVAGAHVASVRAEEFALPQRVAAAVEEFCKSGSATVGISAVDLRSGRPILDVNASAAMIPASNQKLLTSAFALARLGPDFQFTTTVYSLGDDILVTGDGDPTLGDPVLAAAAEKTIYEQLDLWAEAIRRVRGQSIGDLVLRVSWPLDSGRHKDWPKGQRRRWYAAPVASLNFNNNCFDVTFAVADGQATPRVQPDSRFIRIVNKVRVTPKHAWSGRTNEDDSVLTLTGTVSRGSAGLVSVAADHPPLLLGRALAERLARVGVTLGGTIRTAPAASVDLGRARRIAQTTTPLAVALARSNKRSLNMAAECLFLRAGDGTWDGSAASMVQTLQEVYGLDTAGVVVRDGGGLSRGNRVSAATITGLLAAVLRRSDRKLLVDSLAISGIDGTMRRRLGEAPYRGRVLGKTGSIAGVSGLSGYVLDEAQQPAIAFSILVNGTFSARKAKHFQDALCRLLVDYVQRPSAGPATP